jgi:hypothetical protein
MARMTAPPAHTTLAYLRVSTLDQDIEKNKADILRFANQHDLGQVRFVEEIASGRMPWRERRIAEALEALGANDALIGVTPSNGQDYPVGGQSRNIGRIAVPKARKSAVGCQNGHIQRQDRHCPNWRVDCFGQNELQEIRRFQGCLSEWVQLGQLIVTRIRGFRATKGLCLKSFLR